MYAETYRPSSFDDIVGHVEAKESLKKYLTSSNFESAVMLTGSPGIGKTTLALAAAKTFGFEILEINASRSIRSYEDVEKIKDACRSAVSISAFMRGDHNRKTCVILDEIDGSDSHAQGKIVSWIKDTERKVPVICTGNELPTVFKRNSDHINIIRCYPPRSSDIQSIFKDHSITEDDVKNCQHDIRKLVHKLQYGESDPIPKYTVPQTGLPIEETFVLRQKMFGLDDPLRECHVYKLDISQTSKTKTRYKNDDKHVHTDECDTLPKKSRPGKRRNLKSSQDNPEAKKKSAPA